MSNDLKIRVSKVFHRKYMEIRAKCILNGKKDPSASEVTEAISKYIDVEKVCQENF